MQCGETHLAEKSVRRKNNVQTDSYPQTPVCFNLALLINFAKPAQIHAVPRITTHHDQMQYRTKTPPSSRVEGAASDANSAQHPCEDRSKTASQKMRCGGDQNVRITWYGNPSTRRPDAHAAVVKQPSRRTAAVIRSSKLCSRAALESAAAEPRSTARRRRSPAKMVDAKSAADCVMAPPTCTRRGDEAARQYAASTTTNCKI